MTVADGETNKAELTVSRLLTLSEVAIWLGTSERFPRRLVAERRIQFVHVGRHVRIPAAAVQAFLDAATVHPITRTEA